MLLHAFRTSEAREAWRRCKRGAHGGLWKADEAKLDERVLVKVVQEALADEDRAVAVTFSKNREDPR